MQGGLVMLFSEVEALLQGLSHLLFKIGIYNANTISACLLADDSLGGCFSVAVDVA
jgi:hypothetical protein